ncbi:Bifunctional protein GlmU [subsurface metagenome]
MGNLIPIKYFFSCPIDITQTGDDVLEYLERLAYFLNETRNDFFIEYEERGTSLIKNSYIERGVTIGDYSLIRDSYIAKGSTIGFSCEIARSLIMENCMVSHHDFVGDSVLGKDVRIGGAVRFTNRRLDQKQIFIMFKDFQRNTRKYKLGSIIGDNTQIGSGVVINPGTLVGKNCVIYPNLSIWGFVPFRTEVKSEKKREEIAG